MKSLGVLPSFFVLTPFLACGSVMINEIMYHPNSTRVLEEWIEFYNSAPTNVSLAGWKISKGLLFTFPTNVTISSGGYLVVAADTATFSGKYPTVSNVVPLSAGPL